MIKRFSTFARANLLLSVTIALVVVALGYWAYNAFFSSDGETQYVLAEAERGVLSITVSGTGQVSAENQIELTAKASGEILTLPVENGATVAAGTIIARIDARDAQKAVRDAEVNLESAQLALQKLTQPATALSATQAKNALSDAENALAQGYDDGFNEVSDTFLTLPDVMAGLDDILNGNDVSPSQDNAFAYADMIDDIDPKVNSFRDDAIASYVAARADYEAELASYKSASRFSDNIVIEQLILDTYDMTKTVAEATKDVNDLLNLVNDSLVVRNRTVPAILTTHRSALSTHIANTNGQLVALLNIKDSITSSKQLIEERTEALRDLEDGADPLDIASQELVVKQRENSLLDAQENLADYTVRAPFNGTVAKLNVKRADSVSNGTSIATFITADTIAEISLNEIDAANIAVGQRATLTFDAIDDLTIEGAVVEVDTVGAVSSGVVTYTVTIGFDTDPRIKPGMTVNADIVTTSVEHALIVPAGAVKTDAEGMYVEVVTGSGAIERGQTVSGVTPQRVLVKTGLSNDTETEILQGLEVGMLVVTRTIEGESADTASAPSIFQATGAQRPPGGTGSGGGGAVRFQAR